MKPPWVFVMAVGGGAASTLSDRVGISISDKVPSLCTAYHKQLLSAGYCGQDDALLRKAFGGNTASVGLEAVLPNRTKPKLKDQPRGPQRSDHHENVLPVITLRPVHQSETNTLPQPENQQPQKAKSPSAEYDPHRDPGRGPDPASASILSRGTDTGNPASANRAIAGMSVGLLSVMVIFTVFL